MAAYEYLNFWASGGNLPRQGIKVLKMLKAEGKIGNALINNLMSWKHTGFSVGYLLPPKNNLEITWGLNTYYSGYYQTKSGIYPARAASWRAVYRDSS